MYCFHWLINKETTWPDRAELKQAENTELNSGRKKANTENHNGVTRDRHADSFWQATATQ